MIIGEDRNIDWMLNRELCLLLDFTTTDLYRKCNTTAIDLNLVFDNWDGMGLLAYQKLNSLI